MKHIYIILTIISIATISNAQIKTIHVNGCIFAKDLDEAIPVPFATVYYCDYNNPDNVMYMAVTDFLGWYDFGEHIKLQKYFVKIVAPNYITRTKKIGNLPENIKGNLTLHYELQKSSESFIAPTVYLTTNLSKEKTDLKALISDIKGVQLDDAGNLLMNNSESIKILTNGCNFIMNDFDSFMATPSRYIKKMELYDVSKSEESMYKYYLNITSIDGEEVPRKLYYMPIEAKMLEIK